MVAWNRVCQPKQNGGLGIKEVLAWNKAAIGSYLFDLATSDTSTVWHSWVHAYLLKR